MHFPDYFPIKRNNKFGVREREALRIAANIAKLPTFLAANPVAEGSEQEPP